MRTYTECQQAVDRQLQEVTAPYVAGHEDDRVAFIVGFLKRQVVDLHYQIEQLTSKRNQEEMDQLHRKLAGKL